MLRLVDDRVIARDAAARRLAAARISAHGDAAGLIGYRIVDTHVHLVAIGTRSAVARLVRAVELGLRADLSLPVGWDPARFVPIREQHHLDRAFHYVLRNEARHGLAVDVLHDASALPDLLGLRVAAPYLPQRVRQVLPRVTRAQLLAHLGVDTLDPVETVAGLADAAAAAFALPHLSGGASFPARLAAIHACPAASSAVLAASLGVTPRAVQRSRSVECSAAAVRAVQLQLGLRVSRGSAALRPGVAAPAG